jgi:hypothetical protein
MPNLTYQLDFGADLSQVKSAQAEFGKLKSALGGLAQIAGLAAIGESFRRGMSEGVRFNSKLEEIRRGLTAVKGSAGLAAAGLSELQRAEGKSTFDISELGAVIRQMEIMTDGALSSGRGLQLLMDTAAGTETPLASVADALGRVYGQIQAGDPELGRGMQQLIMLGAINATTKNQIETLAAAGASSAAQWAALSGALGRFNGQAATAAGTMAGLKTQLGHAFEEALGGATAGLFGDLKAQMASLADSLRSGPAGAALRELVGSIASAAGAVIRFTGFLLGSRAVLGSLATAIKALSMAWIGMKIIAAVQGLSAWIGAAWKGVAATTASTTALNAETQALVANAAARRISNVAAGFSMPNGVSGQRTGYGSSRSGVLTGRSTTQDAGNTKYTLYTAEALNATLTTQAAKAGALSGSKFASQFSTAIRSALPLISMNFGLVAAAAYVGWEGGKKIRGLSGEASAADYDQASGQGKDNDTRLKGYQEKARSVGSVTEKLELQKQLEEELAEQRAKVQNASLSDPEKEVANAQIAVLINLRRYVKGLDEAKLKAAELAKTQQAARDRNAPLFDQATTKMAHEDQATLREQSLATAGAGAGGPMAQLRLIRTYLAQAKAELGQINLADTANPQYEKMLARAERLRDLIKEMTGKQIELGKTVDEGTQAKEQLALEIQILKLKTSGTSVEERAAERALEIRKKAAELLPMYDTAAAAKSAATQFVDADLAAKAFRPSGEALRPQANNSDRAGLFVGGVANGLQQKGTEAAVQSRLILQRMYDFFRSTKTTPATHWGSS